MEENYLNYSTADFAGDHYFLMWRLAGDRDAELFWEEFGAKYPDKKKNIEEAIRIVNSVKGNHYPLTDGELVRERRRLRANIRKHKRRRRMIPTSAAAALVLVLIGIGIFMNQRAGNVAEQIAGIIASSEGKKVCLIIPGSETVVFEGEAQIEYGAEGGISVADDAGGRMQVAIVEEAAVMNRLIVPGGKRSSLTLPDGSRIWINAGTTLEFPGKFAPDSRDIHVDGEVYVEVIRDEHRPFHLHTPNFTVNVLGTKFNVSSYNADTRHSVVLLEGAVCVSLPDGNTIPMQPDDMLVMQDYSAYIAKVDPSYHTSWREGILNFDGQPLRRVLASVSRFYGIPIEVDYTGEIYISGKLFLFDDVTTVLENLTLIAPVNYGVRKGSVTITRIR